MKKFDFGGNHQLLETIVGMAQAGRLPHAILLEGDKGIGKATLARLIAAAALCIGESKPCGSCVHCRKAAMGVHPDITVAQGGDAARSLHVDTVRALRQDAYILPNEAARKVYILLQAGSMTEQAQNALLKILEEPPADVLFILSCEMRSQLLPTILSRVSAFTLHEVDAEEAVRIVSGLREDLSEEEIAEAHASTGGNIGRILRGLGDAEEQIRPVAEKLLRGLMDAPEIDMLTLVYSIERDRAAMRAVLDELCYLLRDALSLRCGGRALLSLQSEICEQAAGRLSRTELLGCLEAVRRISGMMDSNPNGPLLSTQLVCTLYARVGR